MAKYVKCPRCDLNYMLEGEQYCDVCKAQLKIGPSLLFGDEDDIHEEKLCPICKNVNIPIADDMCENCRRALKYDIEPDSDLDIENDDKWRDFLDEDEKEEISNSGENEEEMLSLSKIQEEEAESLDEEFDYYEEDEEEFVEDEKDDFNYDVDESDFEDTDEDEEDEENVDDDEDF